MNDRHKVFVSYYHREDQGYGNVLNAKRSPTPISFLFI